MMFLLSVTIKIALLILVALGANALLRRRSAALRHWVLTTALFGCLCIPALELFMPAWSIPVPVTWSAPSVSSSLRLVSEPGASPVARTASTDIANASPLSRLFSFAIVMASAWVAGVVVGVAILIAGLWRLRTLSTESEPVSAGPWRDLADDITRRYGLRRHVRLVASPHSTMLATWGVLNPTILLPAAAQEWTHDRIQAVLHHELAHVQRGDWVIALTANLLRAVYWFNPMLWMAYHRLRHEGERACDDLVLASGISGSEYAAHLLGVAREFAQRRHPWSPAIAIAHHSTLEGRVRTMLAARVNREPLSTFMRATTVAVLSTVTVSIGVATVSGDTQVANTAIATSANAPISSRPDLQAIPPGTVPVLSPQPETRPVAPPSARSAAPGAQAQSSGGTIEGVLYDQYGGLLPGASVRLTQVDNGSSQNALTDRGGSFAFRGLMAGDYELVTGLPGFTPVRNVIRAEPGSTVRRHIMLPIGTVQETIHVTCAISGLNTSRPGAPTGSTTPGPTQRQAAAGTFRIEPKMGSTFTGGIGGQIKAPTKLVHVSPVCPTGVTAQPAVVKLAGRIGIDGQFSDLHSTSADAPAAFVASAMDAARQWGFTPTLLNNAPIEANITVTVSYSWN
jgi:beta-lactamase regulating signal transducer with metallopeptidase domain